MCVRVCVRVRIFARKRSGSVCIMSGWGAQFDQRNGLSFDRRSAQQRQRIDATYGEGCAPSLASADIDLRDEKRISHDNDEIKDAANKDRQLMVREQRHLRTRVNEERRLMGQPPLHESAFPANSYNQLRRGPDGRVWWQYNL